MDRVDKDVTDPDDLPISSGKPFKEIPINEIDKNVVKALYSRTFGILSNPLRGCQVHAMHKGVVVPRWKIGKRQIYGADASVVCSACERCLMYEEILRAGLVVEQVEAVDARRKRGSVFESSDSVFKLGGVEMASNSVPSIMTPERAFSILAPPSAGKLYFVLSSCRRKLDHRILTNSMDSKWYLTHREFEKLLFTCGVDWMERAQMDDTYNKFDLNQSGSLHVSELCAVFQRAELLCRQILSK